MRQIKTVEQIFKLAQSGGCVVVLSGIKNSEIRMPAAFVINYQAHYLVQIVKAGRVFYYQPKKKK